MYIYIICIDIYIYIQYPNILQLRLWEASSTKWHFLVAIANLCPSNSWIVMWDSSAINPPKNGDDWNLSHKNVGLGDGLWFDKYNILHSNIPSLISTDGQKLTCMWLGRPGPDILSQNFGEKLRYPLVNKHFANWKMAQSKSWIFPFIAWWFSSSRFARHYHFGYIPIRIPLNHHEIPWFS